ncbi:hypothetical protein [Paenibacillus radicis (ex Gao et al. 2016)]|uniref:hypothetical protein n=1 Tax=Paenibacillus radicis (ex Gao et al. 2016) TaxID=1737354 RepID=UPI00166605CC|nr:hypothetical protein [Paenibacillus radicis (ex Gao et al. 2016)]
MKPYRTNRKQAYIRHHRRRIIQRKKLLTLQLGWVVKHTGSLAKGKIHCSCWWCSQKTYRLGYSKSEQTRIINGEQQLQDTDF